MACLFSNRSRARVKAQESRGFRRYVVWETVEIRYTYNYYYVCEKVDREKILCDDFFLKIFLLKINCYTNRY